MPKTTKEDWDSMTLEMNVMKRSYGALKELDVPDRRRVLDWLVSRIASDEAQLALFPVEKRSPEVKNDTPGGLFGNLGGEAAS